LPIAQALGIDTPLVVGSGALVKDPATARTLYRASFRGRLLHDVLRAARTAGEPMVLYADGYDRGYEFYCDDAPAPHEELAEFLALNRSRVRRHARLHDDPPHDAYAGLAVGSPEAMLALQAHLEALLPALLYTHVLRSPRYRGWLCEIAPAGATKYSGLMRLTGQWGISPQQICAIGDDVNDIPMLRGAGLGIAMAGAPPEVQAAADRVAGPQHSDGLAEAIDRWVLRAQT
jgi:hypothetical protein